MIRIRGIAWPADQYIHIAMVLVIVAASFAARGQALFISTIDWDEGVYLVMAQRWLLGGLPYVAVWDQHPPGLPALLAVIQIVIPDPVFGARLAALCAVIITALLIHRFCARYANQAGAGLIGALLYIVCISRWAGLAAMRYLCLLSTLWGLTPINHQSTKSNSCRRDARRGISD